MNNAVFDEAVNLLDQVGCASANPTIAVHALAAADALNRYARCTPFECPPAADAHRTLVRALGLLAELAVDSVDDELLVAIEHALLAHQAAR